VLALAIAMLATIAEAHAPEGEPFALSDRFTQEMPYVGNNGADLIRLVLLVAARLSGLSRAEWISTVNREG